MPEELKKKNIMPEELKNDKIEEKNENDSSDFIETIQKLKANTVPKEKYEQLERDKKELLKALAGEGELPDNLKPEEMPSAEDIAELVKVIMSPAPDLVLVRAILDLRKAILKTKGEDIFNPSGIKGMPITQEQSDQLAEYLETCLENCGDDPVAFHQIFISGLTDNGPSLYRRK